MEPFKYDPIDHDVPSFRLLRLTKWDGGGIISCKLFHARLDQREEAITYEALSYTWGSSTLAYHIEVNGKRLKVTENLYWALHDLRTQDQDRVLWVDAICINQSHPEERGHQVRQMGDIYRHADQVVIWLGPSTYETNVFMDSMQKLQQEARKHTYRKWKRTDLRWVDLGTAAQLTLHNQDSALAVQRLKGLQHLLDTPWFKRVWILQEVANANAALVCCGTKSTPSQFFSMAPILMGVQPSSHCQSVLDIMPGPLRLDSWGNQGWDLYTLLINFNESQAQDSRDMIYALLGIASDAKSSDILQPDYGKSEDEVLYSTIQFLYHCDPNEAPIKQPRSIRSLLKEFEYGHYPIPSCWAAERGLATAMKHLISQGSDFKGKDTRGWTPLNYAISYGRDPIVQLLLEKGAEADLKDEQGRTPLSYAAEEGRLHITQMLLKKGVDADSKDKQDRTPLSYAAESYHRNVIKILLKKGAEAVSNDKEGRTPLSYAAQKCCCEVSKQRSCNASMSRIERVSLLQKSLSKFIGIVQLFEKGLKADLKADFKDKWGLTTLLGVAGKAHSLITEMRSVAGFGVNVRSEQGRRPLSYIAEEARSLSTQLRTIGGLHVKVRDIDERMLLLYFVEEVWSIVSCSRY
jgi:hypothetical protein